MRFFAPALALAGLATAQTTNVALPVPGGAEIGKLRFPLNCTTNTVGNVSLDTTFTATAPLFAESGRQIYYNDVTSTLVIPLALVQKAQGSSTAATSNVKIFVNLNLTQASPSSLNVFPNGYWVNGTAVNQKGDSVLNVPASGVLPAIGPVTMGAVNTTHLVQLGAISATVYLYDSSGKQIGTPTNVNCPAASPANLVGLVNIIPSNGTQPALSLANGFKPNFPAIDQNTDYGCFRFNFSCTLGFFGPFDFDTELCGGVPKAVAATKQFSLVNGTSFITIPSYVVDAIRNLYPGASRVDNSIKSFYINATNASPASLNGLPTPYNVSSPVPPSGSINLTVPLTGALTIGPFTAANAKGQSMFLSVGSSFTHSIIRNSSGADIGEADINCQPPRVIRVIGINII